MLTRETQPKPTAPLPFRASSTPTGSIARIRDLVLTNRIAGTVACFLAAVIAGLLVAGAMPRGPVTSNQALTLMATGLLVGLVTGLALRSRWAMVLAPAANVLAFEFGRRDTDGPMVDGIHLDTSFGILAFILGRGFYVLIGLVPMSLGVAYGCALSRRTSRERNFRGRRRIGFYARRAVSSLATAGMVGLAVLIALPASVPPVRGADGKEIAGSIAELTQVELGGHKQWIEICAASPDSPVLLWLAGGPGQSDLAIARTYFDALAHDFVFVDWDQRGAGKSYPALDPAGTWTLGQAISDTIELTNYLRARFDEAKIYIAGESWGTTLGVLAVQKRPDLFHAYIASGQMVSQRETDLRIYRDLVAYAGENDDKALANKLEEIGQPPYADAFAYGYILTQYEKIEPDYDPPAAYEDMWSGLGISGEGGSEYTFVEKLNVMRGLFDMFWTMYPQLQGIDFREDVTELEVPIYLFEGEGELAGRRDLAHEWFALVEAPSKQIFTFEHAGHSVAYEQFEGFHRIMVEIVVPETYQVEQPA